MKCNNCGGEIPAKASVCPYCGSEAQEKEKIYIDRPVMVYENEPEPDGLEYRNAKEQMYRYAAICFILAVISTVFGLMASINNTPLMVLPQMGLMLFSLGLAVLTISVCKNHRVKITPFLWVALFADVLSIIVFVISMIK